MLSILRYLKKSVALGGGDINAATVTNGDLTYSESFAPGGMDAIGIILDPGNTSSGTTPTIAAALQVSADGGTTWAPCSFKGSATAFATGAKAKSTPISIIGEIPAVESGEATKPLYRWAFTYAAADNDFTAVTCWLVGRKFGQPVP